MTPHLETSRRPALPDPEAIAVAEKLHDDVLLSRAQASAFLAAIGAPIAVSYLAKLSVVGGGPEYELIGRFPRYRVGKLKAWVAARRSGPRRHTSEPVAA